MYDESVKEKGKAGLTLIELLVVVSILAAVSYLALSSITTQSFKGRDARRKADLRQLQVRLEDYYNDRNCYPQPPTLACNPGTTFQPYITKVPCDPRTNQPYLYQIESSTCPSWYRLFTKLEHEKDPDILEVGCSLGCGPGNVYNYGVSSPNINLK